MPIEVHLRNPSASATAAVALKRKSPPPPPENRWKTGTQQRIYGRRLLEAIRSARGEGSSSPATNPTPPAKIREAADSALALTDRGRSRWSRAILSRRWRRRRLIVKAAGAGRKKIRRRRRPQAKKGEAAKAIGGEKVRERLRVLSRLVPGCRRVSTPSLLEETADYVAALEMQVRAMRLLADALSAASANGE
ncbi:Transcription factor [Acorus gramineus]|uniref:Transcription factor n=1 Tax=Acorus gramineus TaxID=55184 RepID=A0AAV9A412_ACOGR|nr:Transcription factor [Acorus gramineus]